jgi:hypothetical protein
VACGHIASSLWKVSVNEVMQHHYEPSFSAAVYPDESEVLRTGSLCIGGITIFSVVKLNTLKLQKTLM